jgi:hypothetical protein
MAESEPALQLHRLMYASVAEPGLELSKLAAILESAERRNSSVEITGALAYANGFFLQYLEGSRDRLSATLDRIYRDERHSQLCIVEFAPCRERKFSKWAMRHLTFQADDLITVIGARDFRPLEWSIDHCYAYFVKFSRVAGSV